MGLFTLPEAIILEKYQVIKKLGKGGFGTTYLANDSQNNKKCVIKHVALKRSESIKSLDLIKLEGKVMSQLDHPMIPGFIGFVIEESPEIFDVYIIQEYINGKNLFQLIKEGKQFYEKDVIKIALNLSKLLEYLHSFSPPIIHRDIKPENIMLSEDERVHLIDFGAVKEKIIGDRASKLGLSTIIGTQGYMPIEQFEGRAVTASDIYALGLTLVYLLSRKDIYKIDKDGLTLNFQPHVNISQDFSLIIEHMIEADWKKRYHSATELKDDLLLLFDKNRHKHKKKSQVMAALVRSEIREGEKLRWQGYVDPAYIFGRTLSINLLVIILYSFFALLFGWGSFLSYFFYLYLSIILLALFPFNYLANGKLSNFIYVVTDKRVLVIEKGRAKTVRSYSRQDLENMLIKTKQNFDGTGSLIFSKKPYTIVEGEVKYGNKKIVTSLLQEDNKKESIEFDIPGIENVDLVRRIITDIYDNNRYLR